MRTRKKIVLGLVAGLIAAAAAIHLIVPAQVERSLNGLYPTAAAAKPVSGAALALHEKLWIGDMHADTLLWGRDLRRRSAVGHVDIPRLQAGNVALQAFSLPTKTPKNLNYVKNDDTTDNIFWLGLISGWPVSSLSSLKERTLFLGRRLAALASGNPLRMIKTRQDLAAFVEARKRDPKLVAGFLTIEGLHALEGNIETLAALDDAGFRMIGLAHFFDNEVAGSAQGVARGGLTPLGRAVVPELERRHILVDLAHSSAQTIADTLAIARRPVVVSHTGVRATCDRNRNLTDEQLAGVAATGGLIGIGYWEEAVCGHDAAAVAAAIKHAVKVAGIEHVALGSDFDGTTFTPFDASGLAEVTEALMAAGMDEAAIRAVMGENMLRLLLDNLPSS